MVTDEKYKMDFYMENALETLMGALRNKVSDSVQAIIWDMFNSADIAKRGKSIGTILEEFDGQSPSNKTSKGVSMPVNVYPGGIATNEVYPEFICVCAGKTSLGQAFRKIFHYCSCAEKRIPLNMSKTVILLTDKWSAASFRKAKQELLDFNYNENVNIYVYLATEYAFTKLEFPEFKENSWRPFAQFFAGENSKYRYFTKKINNVVMFRHDDCSYTINLRSRKIWLNNRLVCRYIPMEALFDICLEAKQFPAYKPTDEEYFFDKYCADNYIYTASSDYVIELKGNKFCYDLKENDCKFGRYIDDILCLHDAIIDLFNSTGLAEDNHLIALDLLDA